MAESPLRGGELNAAITSALVGIQNAHLGRGPTSASTFHHANVVVTLMNGVMTPAEKTLASSNKGDAVVQMRQLFQETMEPDFRTAVERLTGCRVIAFISGNHIHPDVATETFVLDSSLTDGDVIAVDTA